MDLLASILTLALGFGAHASDGVKAVDRAAAEACERLFGSRGAVLAQLSASELLNDTDAEHATLTPVTVTYPPPRNLLGFIPRPGTRPLEGLMIVGPDGPPIVVVSSRNTLTVLKPEVESEAQVWDKQDVRRLRVVNGRWAWEGVPPARRGIGDMSLSSFVETYGPALEQLLLAGKLNSDDVLDSLVYRGTFRAENLVFLVKKRGDSFTDTFVHVFDGAAPFGYRHDFGASREDAAEFAEVGPKRQRLFVRQPGSRNVRREFGWAAAIGAATRISPYVKQPAFTEFLVKYPHAFDTLALMDRAPSETSLHRASVEPARSELTPITYQALLVPTGAGPDAPIIPWLFNPDLAEWVDAATLAERSAFVLPDGRRIGAGANGGLRWLGHRDALARLREVVRGR